MDRKLTTTPLAHLLIERSPVRRGDRTCSLHGYFRIICIPMQAALALHTGSSFPAAVEVVVLVEDSEVAVSLAVNRAGQRAQVRRAALASSIGTTIE